MYMPDLEEFGIVAAGVCLRHYICNNEACVYVAQIALEVPANDSRPSGTTALLHPQHALSKIPLAFINRLISLTALHIAEPASVLYIHSHNPYVWTAYCSRLQVPGHCLRLHA